MRGLGLARQFIRAKTDAYKSVICRGLMFWSLPGSQEGEVQGLERVLVEVRE